MKYKFAVNKKNYEIEITANATFYSETQLKVNKSNYNVLIGEADEKEVKSIYLNNRLYQIELELDQKGYPSGIYVNGEYYPASLIGIDKLFYYREKQVKKARSGRVKSFIPGSVKKVLFSINDKVKENEIVLIYEAMKMENEIRAPRSGIIKTINVSEGENTLANHLLFEIE